MNWSLCKQYLVRPQLIWLVRHLRFSTLFTPTFTNHIPETLISSFSLFSHFTLSVIIPLKKVVCVCLSVCHHVCGKMAARSNMVSSEVNTIYKNTRNCNTCQDDPFPDPDNMDQPDHTTFWPITSKLMDGFRI